MEKIKFYSVNNPYLFMRHDSIGVIVKDIREFNRGIQFSNCKFETDDIMTIEGLRNS